MKVTPVATPVTTTTATTASLKPSPVVMTTQHPTVQSSKTSAAQSSTSEPYPITILSSRRSKSGASSSWTPLLSPTADMKMAPSISSNPSTVEDNTPVASSSIVRKPVGATVPSIGFHDIAGLGHRRAGKLGLGDRVLMTTFPCEIISVSLVRRSSLSVALIFSAVRRTRKIDCLDEHLKAGMLNALRLMKTVIVYVIHTMGKTKVHAFESV
ncbi:hypothetical protein KI688_006693 [Linnemannia hyalina]|uniref:Uncharacterized protein n=1 Tax=Linnemannia hyalina TaxID=64524 RepID=A0A9P8BNM2_9FUNG|nr:hypothetical protein KI688_006693 [Linnemannia hyalina]